MRWTHALAVLLIVALVAACGGSGGDGEDGDGNGGEGSEAAAPSAGDGAEESQDTGSGDGDGDGDGGNGSGSLDVDRVFETLTPPNATELSKTTTAGVIFAAFESAEDLDSLRSFYEGAIDDAGLQIIATTEAQGGLAWTVAESEGSSFGGVISLFPSTNGGGTQISVTIGEGGAG